MLDYRLLSALVAVVRTGSFEGAATELGLTQSAVSQRIRLLEERVGAVLVQRGQPCTATPRGRKLVRHAEDVALLESRLDDDLAPRDRAELARIRLAVNADSLATWLPDALAAVPGFLFDLEIDDQDHSAAWLRRGEVSAAVTAHPGPVQGCDSHPLGALRYVATASPDFVARHFRDGVTPAALSHAPSMTFDAKDRLQSSWARQVAGRPVRLRAHVFPSSQAFVDAALAGIGWGMNPEPLVRDHVAAGRLVVLRPDLPLDTPLHWQVSRLVRDVLAPLSAAVARAARRHLVAVPKGAGG